MNISKNAELNTVSAKNQLDEDKYVNLWGDVDGIRVLFVGNSITRHAPAPSIGWYGDWGMAASTIENDYVHIVEKRLREMYGKVYCCIAQASKWENEYFNGSKILNRYYEKARAFNADIIIIRLGENIDREKSKSVPFESYYDEMVKFFKPRPVSRIIITNNFWRMDVSDSTIKRIAEKSGYTFCSLRGIEDDERTMAIGKFKHKGVSIHPSDYGMKCIADRIIDKIECLERGDNQ